MYGGLVKDRRDVESKADVFICVNNFVNYTVIDVDGLDVRCILVNKSSVLI